MLIKTKWVRAIGILISLLAVTTCSVLWAGESASSKQNMLIKSQVNRAYSKFFDDFFSRIIKVSKKYEKAEDFFTHIYDFPKNDPHLPAYKKQLAGARTPRIYSIERGLEFEFSPTQKFKLQLSDRKMGDVFLDGELISQNKFAGNSLLNFKKLQATFHLFNEWLLLPVAHAQYVQVAAWGFKAVRLLFGQAIRATAVGAAAGAVGGCGIAIQLKPDYEQVDQACYDGAYNGAMLMGSLVSLPFFNSRTDALISRTAQITAANNYLKVFGALGLVATVGIGLWELKDISGSVLRCQGGDGDYILSARVLGATRYTLYESFGEKFTFYGKDKQEKQVGIDKDSLIKHLDTLADFKPFSVAQLEPLAEQMRKEREEYKSICKKNGAGYTQNFSISESSGTKNLLFRNPMAK